MYPPTHCAGGIFRLCFVCLQSGQTAIIKRFYVIFLVEYPGKTALVHVPALAGVTGSRVIDNAGPRFLTMLLVWSIPCGTTLSLAPMLGGIFFGPVGSALVLVVMAAMTIGSMYLASCIFGKQLVDDTQSHGLVMELPPYHKPKWRHILRSSLMKAWEIFWRAFTVIYAVSIVFYLLSYPWGGGDSLLTQIGAVISPVTEFFGMTWQMFIAYLSSMLTKESLLGVINALYSNSDVAAAAFNAKSVGVSESLSILLPQAISCVFYHIGLLIW